MDINNKCDDKKWCDKFYRCTFTNHYRNGSEGGDKEYMENIRTKCMNKENSKNCERLK